MYKHANDEVPLKVSGKKYLEKVSWRYYLYLVSSRYFSKVSSSCIFKILFSVSSSCIFKILFKSILHNTGAIKVQGPEVKGQGHIVTYNVCKNS